MLLKIKSEIYINKSVAEVWKVFSDFSSYPDWNPFLTKIKKLNDNELEVEFMSQSTFNPRILTNKPNQEFRWLGKLGGVRWLFMGEHYFILKPEQKGTLFIQGEIFNGILAWLLWPFINGKLTNNFKKMNDALKMRVEKI